MNHCSLKYTNRLTHVVDISRTFFSSNHGSLCNGETFLVEWHVPVAILAQTILCQTPLTLHLGRHRQCTPKACSIVTSCRCRLTTCLWRGHEAVVGPFLLRHLQTLKLKANRSIATEFRTTSGVLNARRTMRLSPTHNFAVCDASDVRSELVPKMALHKTSCIECPIFANKPC